MGGRGPSAAPRPRKPHIAAGDNDLAKDPCDISFVSPLAHVRTAQSKSVAVGETLDVIIEMVMQKKTIACRRQNGGAIIGFVLHRTAARLIECIEQDNIFVAEVRKADFGHVEVLVRRS